MNLLTITLLIMAGCSIIPIWMFITLKHTFGIEARTWMEDRTEHRRDLREPVRTLTDQASTHPLIIDRVNSYPSSLKTMAISLANGYRR